LVKRKENEIEETARSCLFFFFLFPARMLVSSFPDKVRKGKEIERERGKRERKEKTKTPGNVSGSSIWFPHESLFAFGLIRWKLPSAKCWSLHFPGVFSSLRSSTLWISSLLVFLQ